MATERLKWKYFRMFFGFVVLKKKQISLRCKGILSVYLRPTDEVVSCHH